MPITHVNTQSTPGTAVTTTLTITKPTGLAVGDVMVGYITSNQDGITGPSGWMRLYQLNASVNTFRYEIWYIVATSTQTAATNFTWTNSAGTTPPMFGAISAYRGVDQNNPINTSNSNIQTTGASQNTPTLSTTKSAWILYARTIREASATIHSFSSSPTNERFDGGNHGASTNYAGAAYDNNGETASGSIAAVSITDTGTPTDGITVAIALTTADTNAAPGSASATAGANDATVAKGSNATAGKASVTAAALQPNVLAGTLAFAGRAAVTAAVPDVQRQVRPAQAAATAAGLGPAMFFGTPGYRTKVIPNESRTLVVGQN